MGSFAAVIMQLEPPLKAGAAPIAQDIVASFPGTRNTVLDEAKSVVTFELHFPGNLSGLVRRLADRKIGVADSVTVSVPVASLVPELVASQAAADERLLEGSEVWDPEFTRGSYVLAARLAQGRVEATIVPSTEAMHQIYDGMLALALVGSDTATPVAEAL
jgi:hypothetical protein